MEYKKERLIMIICLALFLVCMWLIVMGQKKISFSGLGMMMLGLIGLLALLWYYNWRHSK
ncbi:MAG: hypothetical protein Q4B90_04570 [Eubacteriales bacterium]|nr:hypothetical protein [Clostridiales bacterium]MDO4453749.1 hypothetical protein [Eubacteriales bacterium]